MPSYSKIIFILLVFISFVSCTNQQKIPLNQNIYNEKPKVIKKKTDPKVLNEMQENLLITYALDYELNNDILRSAMVYENLYNKYNKFEYLEKSLSLYVYNENFKKVYTLSLKNINKYEDYKEYLYQNFIFSAIKINRFNESLKYSKKLIKINNSTNNYMFLADSYYGIHDYKNAMKYYKYIFNKNKSSVALMNYTNILFVNYNQRQKAVKYLKKYAKTITEKKLLANYYTLLGENMKVLNLYKEIYKNTHDLTTLGHIAMHENEYNRKNVKIEDIYAKFEKVLKEISNPIFENYYGYILLENNKDVKKALKLIQKAYESNPENIYFKDSLAFAYYKNKQYKKAYNIMKEVIARVGTTNSEIKEHWDKINKNKDK